MAKPPSSDAADKAFVDAWDTEIDAEESEERALQKQARVDGREARQTARSERARLRARLFRAAGITEDEVQQQADKELARMRESAALQRRRALGLFEKRAVSNATEAQKMIAGIRRGE